MSFYAKRWLPLAALPLTLFGAAGDLDTTFGGDGIVTTSGTNIAFSLALQNGGKIIAAGLVNNDFGAVRYHDDGTIDTSFNGGIVTTSISSNEDDAYSVSIDSDGKILLAGVSNIQIQYSASLDEKIVPLVNSEGAGSNFALVRYNSNGTLDASFGSSGIVETDFGYGDDAILDHMIYSDGKIMAVGDAYTGSDTDFALARYNSDGSLDTSFGTSGKVTTSMGYSFDTAYRVSTFLNDTILAAGTGSTTGDSRDFAVARYLNDGSLDTTFGNNGKVTTPIGSGDDTAYGMTIQSDNKIVLAGASYNGNNDDFALVRYNIDGSIDTTFGSNGVVVTDFSGGDDRAYCVIIQNDGKLIASGSTVDGNYYNYALSRYNSDGTLDTSFGTGGKTTTNFTTTFNYAIDCVMQNDNKIVQVGLLDGTFGLARYENDVETPASTTTPKYDFDGDGKADILWRDTVNNNLFMSFMNGLIKTSEGYVTTSGWDIPAIFDFDGDGKADILWRDPSNDKFFMSFMDGLSKTSEGFVTISTWDVLGVADFDGDGKGDILWRDASDYIFMSLMDGRTKTDEGFITISTWDVLGLADFDGDGKADLLRRDPSTNSLYIRFMDGKATTGEGYVTTSAWDVLATADFDGDGKADILWRDPSTTKIYMSFMDGTTKSSEGYVTMSSWDVLSVSDFNGDGKADILWRAATTNNVYMSLMDGLSKTGEGYITTSTWEVISATDFAASYSDAAP